jgi:hypothetical protein
MNRILQLSKFGFKLDSNPDVWAKIDKSFLDSDMFKSLKKGDTIDSMTVNSKGYIIGLDRLTIRPSTPLLGGVLPANSGGEVSSPFLPSFSSDRDNQIRYSQSVNLAFSLYDNAEVDWRMEHLSLIFDKADIIFDEFNKRTTK